MALAEGERATRSERRQAGAPRALMRDAPRLTGGPPKKKAGRAFTRGAVCPSRALRPDSAPPRAAAPAPSSARGAVQRTRCVTAGYVACAFAACSAWRGAPASSAAATRTRRSHAATPGRIATPHLDGRRPWALHASWHLRADDRGAGHLAPRSAWCSCRRRGHSSSAYKSSAMRPSVA